MKRFTILIVIFTGFMAGANIGTYAQNLIYYVSNDAFWTNWDIYSYNRATGVETRLTTDPAIDNHPAISHYDTNQIVFSSTRGAANKDEFNIFIADVNNIDGTAKQLTDFSHYGVAGMGPYPNRHPHWHPNGRQIIFTSKNRAYVVPDTVVSECSHPIPIFIINNIRYRYFEGMNVIEIDNAGNVVSYTQLDVSTANSGSVNWPADEQVYVGHPSFNHTGDKIVFTAAVDGEGKVWEVYTAGYDPISKSLIPNSLNQVTSGPNVTSNPIKLSGGASFSYDDSKIIFNSTRTSGGNSQIYSVPATASMISVENATRLTSNHGNDYVPEPLPNGDILITSDLGPSSPVCDCPNARGDGATTDLDVVRLHYDQDTLTWREIQGIDANDQTLLIADEVSWFCGLKPNLSSCKFEIRTMRIWNLWLEKYNIHIPQTLLEGYGPAYSNNAQELYNEGWNNLSGYLGTIAPDELFHINMYADMLEYGFPGWSSPQLPYWMMMNDSLGRMKFVVPALMHGFGLGDSCVFTGIGEPGANDLSGNSFNLIQNYPNPFSGVTTIDYELKEKGFVDLKVYDLLGNVVATLVHEQKPQGKHSVTFHADQLPGGIYYNSMRLKNSAEIRKMVLIK